MAAKRGVLIVMSLAAVVVLVGSAAAVSPTSGVRSAHPGLVAWHHLAPSNNTGPLDRFGMAYDPSTNSTVLFGGYLAGTGTFGNTWVYYGGNWRELAITSGPAARSGIMLVYDPALKGVLLFGGEGPAGSGAYYNDTWLWTGGNWTQLTPASSPSPRSQYAMAYDAFDHEIVLFGGYDGSSVLSDTWLFYRGSWHLSSTPTQMGPRQFATASYDAIDQQVILVGGLNSTYVGRVWTWAFHGGTWKHIATHGGPSNAVQPMSTTLPNGAVLLFGGQIEVAGQSTFSDASWVFVSGAWFHVFFSHPPSPRKAGGLVYDRADGVVLQYGGADSATFLNDTWALR